MDDHHRDTKRPLPARVSLTLGDTVTTGTRPLFCFSDSQSGNESRVVSVVCLFSGQKGGTLGITSPRGSSPVVMLVGGVTDL